MGQLQLVLSEVCSFHPSLLGWCSVASGIARTLHPITRGSGSGNYSGKGSQGVGQLWAVPSELFLFFSLKTDLKFDTFGFPWSLSILYQFLSLPSVPPASP
jgi:hypothetical protein